MISRDKICPDLDQRPLIVNWIYMLKPPKTKNKETTDSVAITRDWLRKTFPRTFIKRKPLPLKEGILGEIFERVPQDGSISKKMVRVYLKKYTHSQYYHQAMMEYPYRVDLLGEPVCRVSDEHRENAKHQLAQILAWQYLKKKEE